MGSSCGGIRIRSAGAAAAVAPASPLAAELSAALQPILTMLSGQLTLLAGTIDHLVETNASLADEIARLRTTTVVRATSRTSLERRIAGLEKLLRQSQQPAEVEVQEGTAAPSDAGGVEESTEEGDWSESQTLIDVLRQAARATIRATASGSISHRAPRSIRAS